MELNKTAAYVFDSAGKIFVVPFLSMTACLIIIITAQYSLCAIRGIQRERFCVARQQTRPQSVGQYVLRTENLNGLR